MPLKDGERNRRNRRLRRSVIKKIENRQLDRVEMVIRDWDAHGSMVGTLVNRGVSASEANLNAGKDRGLASEVEKLHLAPFVK